MKIKNSTILIIFFVNLVLFQIFINIFFPSKDVYKLKTKSDVLLHEAFKEIRFTLAAYLWMKSDNYNDFITSNAKISWRQIKEQVYLMKFITTIDPHFIQAYDFGGYHLAIDLGKFKEGVKFLEEGLKNNPDSWLLNFELGVIYYFVKDKKYKDYKKAAFYLKRAQELVLKDKNPYLSGIKKKDLPFQYLKISRLLGWALYLSGKKEEAINLYMSLYKKYKLKLLLKIAKDWIKNKDSES